jgi:hypothetical protein
MCGDTEADIQLELIRSLRSLSIDNPQHGLDFYKLWVAFKSDKRLMFLACLRIIQIFGFIFAEPNASQTSKFKKVNVSTSKANV